MQGATVKKLKLAIPALLTLTLIILLLSIFLYFYQRQKKVIVYIGTEEQDIHIITKTLDLNHISYKIKIEDYTKPGLNETIKRTLVEIRRDDFEKAAALIRNQLHGPNRGDNEVGT